MAKETWKHILNDGFSYSWSKLKNNGFKIMKILTNAE